MTPDQVDPRAAPEPGAYRPQQADAQRLATFPRGETEELRVEIAECEGRPIIGIRIWFQGSDGRWYPTRKGVSVRLKELAILARVFGDPELQLSGRRTGATKRQPTCPNCNRPCVEQGRECLPCAIWDRTGEDEP